MKKNAPFEVFLSLLNLHKAFKKEIAYFVDKKLYYKEHLEIIALLLNCYNIRNIRIGEDLKRMWQLKCIIQKAISAVHFTT